jgi:UPF0716 family protein affecting phage T7 exclusion
VLFNLAIVFLGAWLVSLSGIFQVGDLVHVLLLVGLMLLLLAFVKGREAARHEGRPPARSDNQR